MKKREGVLKEVDRVEILTLIDNYVDLLLESTDIVTRPARTKEEELPRDTLLAEHGLSLLITVSEGKKRHTILMDTGHSAIGVLHNIERLEVDVSAIEGIVMSHAHMDHTGSLYPLLEKMSGPVPMVVHPYAFTFPRYVKRKDGRLERFPRTLVRSELEKQGVKIVEAKGPTPLAEGMILVTGEVERRTAFEKGMPNAFVEKDGALKQDPVSDDQALVIHLRDKGLVVIGGCSHAGIVNTILHAKKISGIDKVHAVLGGFHLTGPLYEPIIEETIKAIREMRPEVVVPMHCTGWNAIERFSEEFPSAFILNSVGSKYTFLSSQFSG
ncbi:MAG: MBL fold metallo-hydrolase [Proteobacteria bacterium]|nr:MBL fold metallo-hydrolase [Pseudomonadota bacterium]